MTLRSVAWRPGAFAGDGRRRGSARPSSGHAAARGCSSSAGHGAGARARLARRVLERVAPIRPTSARIARHAADHAAGSADADCHRGRLGAESPHGPHAVATMVDLAARGVIAIEEAPGGRAGWAAGSSRGWRRACGTAPARDRVARRSPSALEHARGSEVPLARVQRRFANAAKRVQARSAGGDARIWVSSIRNGSPHGGCSSAPRDGRAVLALAGVGRRSRCWRRRVRRLGGRDPRLVRGGRRGVRHRGRAASRSSRRRARGWRRDGRRTSPSSAGSRRTSAPNDPIAAEWLPYAVAAAVGAAWVRRLAATPGRYAPPAWFHAASPGEDHAARPSSPSSAPRRRHGRTAAAARRRRRRWWRGERGGLTGKSPAASLRAFRPPASSLRPPASSLL